MNQVKKLLERLIYGGEQLARQNNVMSAYTTGVLKHRNIDGTVAIIEDEAESEQPSDNDDPQEKEGEDIGDSDSSSSGTHTMGE
jgi:hypothetical protein